MRKHDREIFFKMIRGKVSFNELLRRHTTFKIGGPAEVWIEPADIIELRLILKYARDNGIPYFVMGNGSNLLICDKGINGFVIRLSSEEFRNVEVVGENVVVGSGSNLQVLVDEMRNAGLSGLEPFVGIPGTLGGAVYMNAGIKDHWIGDIVRGVSLVDKDGSLFAVEGDDLGFGYRGCAGLGDSVVIDVVLGLKKASREEIDSNLAHFRGLREKTQPRGFSAGCVFKNTQRLPAGYIIDRLGFKGERVGGAFVSDVHANFILNDGTATAADVLGLINRIRARALEKEGVVLEPELKILGENNYAAI